MRDYYYLILPGPQIQIIYWFLLNINKSNYVEIFSHFNQNLEKIEHFMVQKKRLIARIIWFSLSNHVEQIRFRKKV